MNTPGHRLTSRMGKRYFPDRKSAEAKDESKYLLEDDEAVETENVSSLPWNNNFRIRKAKEEDSFEAAEVLVSGAGRPPTRPPNDQCAEAEIRPDDTLASIALRFNVPVAELKRVNRLLKDNDLFARKTIKIPIKADSLLTEILPFSDKETYPKSDQYFDSDPSLRESPDMMVAPTPEVRRAQRLLHKIDNSVRHISQRQEDLQQEMSSSSAIASGSVSLLPSDSEKQTSWMDRLNTNKNWICFYLVIIAVAYLTVWMLTKYESGVLKNPSKNTPSVKQQH